MEALSSTFTSAKDAILQGKPTVHTVRINTQVRKSQELHTLYDTGDRQTWVSEIIEDRQFEGGAQWTQKQINILKSMRMAPIAINVLKPAVANAIAMLTNNDPQFQSTAIGDTDVKVSRLMSDVMSWTWHKSDANMEFKVAVHDYYVAGMGVMHAFVDPRGDFGNGQVKYRSVNPTKLFIDPNCVDMFCRDAAHMLIVEDVTRERLIIIMPDKKDIIMGIQSVEGEEDTSANNRQAQEGQKLQETQTDSPHEKIRVIDRYTKDALPFFHIYDPKGFQEHVFNEENYRLWREESGFKIFSPFSDEVILVTADAERARFQQIFDKTGGIFHLAQDGTVVPGSEQGQNAVPGSTRILEEVPMGDFVDDDTFVADEILENRIRRVISGGDQLLFDGYLEIDDYPIVPFMNHWSRNPYPMSDIRFVKGLQQYLNKTHSLIMAHAANATNVKVFVDKGSTNIAELEQRLSKAGAAVIEIDMVDGTKPVIAQPIPLPNELYRNMAETKRDIENILGVFAMSGGDASSAPTTFRGALAIDEFGQRRSKSKRSDLEGALNQFGRVALQLIQDTYTEHQFIRLLQPNNREKSFEINKPLVDEISGEIIGMLNDITVGKHDMIVVSGSTLPNNRWAVAEYYLELLKAGVIDNIEVLKKTDVADADEVMERMSEVDMLRQAVQSQEEGIKELQAVVTSQDNELRHKDRQVADTKHKEQLQGEITAISATRELTKQRLNDKLKELNKKVSALSSNIPSS